MTDPSGSRCKPSINRNNCTTNKAARLRCQIESDPCHIVRVSHPFHWRIIDYILRSFVVDRGGHLRGKISRSNGVDRDMLRRENFAMIRVRWLTPAFDAAYE